LNSEDELRSTAFHEAGHAVAAYHLGRGFGRVSIEPDEDSLGRVRHHAGRKNPVAAIEIADYEASFGGFINGKLRRRLEIDVMIGLAGGLVEQELTGKEQHEVGIGLHKLSDEERTAFTKKFGEDTAFLLTTGDLHIAWGLLNKVSGSDEEASAYLEWLFERTRNLISMPGFLDEVRSLADDLLDHGRLSGVKAREAIRAGRERWTAEAMRSQEGTVK
jgi:hypothetical protein